MKKYLFITLFLALFLVFRTESHPINQEEEQVLDQSIELQNFSDLNYTEKDVIDLHNRFSDEDMNLILHHQIYKDQLTPYLIHPYFSIKHYFDYKQNRETYNLTPFEAINYTHNPFIINLNRNQSEEITETKDSLFKDTPLILVNKRFFIPQSYQNNDLVLIQDLNLVIPGDYDRNRLSKVAYIQLKSLFQDAAYKGYQLFVSSAYRSYERQEVIYNQLLLEDYNNAMISAKPGHSEHQTGLSVDITCRKVSYYLDERFADTEEGQFVLNNAHHYGFIIRYPRGKEQITGYLYEPWHLRYVGKEAAKVIYDEDLTLEEYIFKYIPLGNEQN
jgi:LAS superfamily LD-carboxypeptidase LdcB